MQTKFLIYTLLVLIFSLPKIIFATEDIDSLIKDIYPTQVESNNDYLLDIEQIIPEKSVTPTESIDEIKSTLEKPIEYKVQSNNDSIRFKVQKDQIIFDSFKSKSNQEKEIQLTVSTTKTGYKMMMNSNYPFSAADGQIVGKTVCDLKKQCTESRGSKWTDVDISGIGYSLKQENSGYEIKTFYQPPDDLLSIIKNSMAGENSYKMSWKVSLQNPPDNVYSGKYSLIVLPYK